MCVCVYICVYLYVYILKLSDFQHFIFVLEIYSFFPADTKCKSHDMPAFQFFSILREIFCLL